MKRARILIVDDDPVNREIFRWSLQPFCEIDELSNGEGAASQIVREEYDLVLLDVMMPLVDGIEVVERLNSKRADLLRRVLVVTAAMNHSVLEQLRPFPLAGIVERPYDPEGIKALYSQYFH